VLGAIRYSPSRVLLHRDTSLLPQRKRAWSSWNYRVSEASNQQATTTYYMNMLQNLSTDQDYCVTLNDGGQVDPSKILQEMEYWHPVFDRAALEAQDRVEEVSGVLNTHYCGAYWGYGFHEDGVQSGLRVVRELKESLVYA
ncbi:MAG: FAD-dependent oxidoreductase, partial [Candidatus Eisenbacteria bacterium]|nr:FAD-dependent oxidoreductase [Candidatus Eisenbacteria bacterium]